MKSGEKSRQQKVWEVVKILILALAIAWLLDRLPGIIRSFKK